jgi:hypothetical protein
MITLTREEAQQVLCAIQENWRTHEGDKAIETLRARLAEKEQEPVAWFTEDYMEDKSATTYSKEMAERWKEKGWPVTPLYTAPQRASSEAPQREWQGLTDEEIRSAWRNVISFYVGDEVIALARAVEYELKEKNT